MKQWEGFQSGAWEKEINVRDFIQQNITVYTGDETFLAPATDATHTLWQQ
ncbi:MAG: formate acetyltransferase, partial [Paenibacillaceae bacterium]|nr:formate acetyltransferase [Paenibacillaceae bacterium]